MLQKTRFKKIQCSIGGFSHVLCCRERIISKLKTHYWRRTHKFVIKIPNTAKESMQLDRATGTNLWERDGKCDGCF